MKKIKINLKSSKSIMIYLFSAYFMYLMFVYVRQEAMTSVRTRVFLSFFGLWLILSMFTLLELPKFQSFLKKYPLFVNIPLLLLAPFLSFLGTEVMVGNYNLKMFRAYGIYNVIWFIFIYYLIYAILGSVRYTVLTGNLIIYMAAMINYIVYQFRGNPILPSDILVWRTGLSVASNYNIKFTDDFIYATMLMFTLAVLSLRLEKGGKKSSVLKRCIAIGSFVVFGSFVYYAFFETDLVSKKIRVIDFFAPKYTYSDYGTAFGFVANAWSMSTDPPEGYSLEIVDSILAEASTYGDIPIDDESKPNIIVIMNEAFSDLSMLGDYKANQDYLPFIRSLEENTTKGTLYTSVYGGATSDTEYEFLTGNSMAVMPTNSVPYQQFVTEPTDSLATTLKALNYVNVAIHPYEPTGYKRDLVYPLIGFDKFLSIHDFTNPQTIRSYITDRESYKKIIEVYENKSSAEPLFVFNVTMQNHGGYSGNQNFSEEETVRLTEYSGYSKVEQYLSLLRESDKAFQSLVEYFDGIEDPTIILLFGDHQPIAYSEIYDNMEERILNPQLKYKVPFILWANYDIMEDDVDKMSANYLSSYLLKIAGLPGTAYNKYLMSLYEDIPVITGRFYIDKEDVLHQLSDTSSPYYSKIKEYQYIGYNNALDKKNRLKKYYCLN